MKYAKPEITAVGSAVVAVQGEVKGSTGIRDNFPTLPATYTVSAYQADE